MSYIKISFCVLLYLSVTTAAIIVRAPSNGYQPICYDTFGCYVPRPGYKTFPESPKKINTKFFLYTRNNPTQAELISPSNLASLNPTKPIKLIIHGFTDTALKKWVIDMTRELLKSDDMNVIAVDWSGGNQFPYNQAAANTVIVAAAIRQLLQSMIEIGATPQQVHLIGHSLGAHVSSYVGRNLPNLGRISGLDPAGPDFYTSDSADRLDSSDALFVDVIHTDGAPRIQSGFGYLGPIGHVDFYPNGGSVQPTCGTNTGDVILQTVLTLVSTMNIANTMEAASCSHISAIFYYTDSINTPSPAYAYPCSDYKSFEEGKCTSCGSNIEQCQQMGYRASPNHKFGSLYLMTLHGLKPPHFGFHFKVTLESDMNNGQQTRGIFKIKFNGQQEETSIFSENTLMKYGTSISRTILLTDNLTMPKTLSISFRKDRLTNLGIGLAEQWRFRSITVLDMQSNMSYKFCPTSDSLLTYHLCI